MVTLHKEVDCLKWPGPQVVHKKRFGIKWAGLNVDFTSHLGAAMAFALNSRRDQSSTALRRNDRLTLGLIGMGVIFASLGLGEAVYRFAFRDFDGATDRLPIEMMFGLAFAWMATKLVRRIYRYRMETSERINFIRDRNYNIRHAVEAIGPVPYPTSHQAIRVIREEVERIEWALTEITPR
jgi:hypothetical protein